MALLATCLALISCSDGYLTYHSSGSTTGELGQDVEVIVLDATNIEQFARPAREHRVASVPGGNGWTYLVGNGDALSVIVFNHPELTIPVGERASAIDNGFVVNSQGSISYPYIGDVRASGRTVDEIRSEITTRLAEYISEPQVDVRIASYNAQTVLVSGEVRSPNRQVLTSVPLTLVAAINAAGGFTEAADAQRVTVQRGGHKYEVDVEGFIEAGISQNNPVLRRGDAVGVPRRRTSEAYVLGEVMRPNVIDLSQEDITLTQAVTRTGGLSMTRADARGILVFREAAGRTLVFQLDTSKPTGLVLGTRFVLAPNDVIYIVRSPLQRWNDTISRILPTAQAVRVGQDIRE